MRRLYATLLHAVLVFLASFPLQAAAQSAPRALPALLSTPRFQRAEQRTFTLLGAAGYGAREHLHPGDESHQLLMGSLAAAAEASWGLAGELRVDGRTDHHKSDSARGDEGRALVGELRGALRYTLPVANRLQMGAELGIWLPGSKAPSLRMRATTLDALLGLAARLHERVSLLSAVGFRLDRSSEAVSHPERLSRGDFVALGVSDANAVLARVGTSIAFAQRELFAEWTWDLAVGKQAPETFHSPMHLALGGRLPLTSDLPMQLTIAARALLSQRPTVDLNGPLTPYPARGELWLALSYQFVAGGQKREEKVVEPAPVELPVEDTTLPQFEPTTQPTVEPSEPVVSKDGQLRLLVRDHRTGQPLLAEVHIQGADDSHGKAEIKRVDEQGKLELTLAPGRYELTIKLPRYRKQIKKIEVEAESVIMLDVALHARSQK